MKKFAFYASSTATRLKKFLLNYKNSTILKNIDFVLIDNVNNDELEKLCYEYNIQYYKVNMKEVKDKNLYISDLFLEYLILHKTDYGFIFANKILVGDILILYKNKLINFHPSLLPSHKGLFAVDQGLKNNTFLLGNTAHIVTEDLDEGAVIMQNIFPAMQFSTYDDILDKQLIMLLQIMIWIDEDRLVVTNNDVIIKKATYLVEEYIPNLEIKNES